jgi:hypothetical protein
MYKQEKKKINYETRLFFFFNCWLYLTKNEE